MRQLRDVYVLKPGIKRDPVRRWALPDRIFFGYGACHILAGVYLQHPPLAGFHAERIIPADDLPGGHMYVTDGHVAFDCHGYSNRLRLLEHHRKGWAQRHPGWDYTVLGVDFPPLDTAALNARKMRGPDQYLFDPIPRARRFIERIDHAGAAAKAAAAHPRPAAPSGRSSPDAGTAGRPAAQVNSASRAGQSA